MEKILLSESLIRGRIFGGMIKRIEAMVFAAVSGVLIFDVGIRVGPHLGSWFFSYPVRDRDGLFEGQTSPAQH